MNLIEKVVYFENESMNMNTELRYDEAISLSDKAGKLIAKHKSHIPPNLLGRHIVDRMSVFLNKGDFNSIDTELYCFDKYLNGKRLSEEVRFKRYWCQCEKEYRIGNFQKVVKVAESALKVISKSEYRCKLYLVEGRAEMELNGGRFKVTSLSDALAEAEKSEDKSLTAEVYMELSRMLSMRYRALGIYFLRKAETIYEWCKDKYRLNRVHMYRALNSMLIFEKYPSRNNIERFKNEAERLVDLIDEELFRTESEKCFFQSTKAFIVKDENLLSCVIEYFRKVGAAAEVSRYVEMYIEICLNKGENAKALAMLPLYRERYIDKPEILARISELENDLKTSERVNFIPPFDDTPQERTLLDILDHISFYDELWALDKSKIRDLFPSYLYEGLFEAIVMPDGKTSLFPCLTSFNSYYRGQSKYYDECRPALFRGGMTEPEVFVERLKYAEMKLLIKSHPLCEIYDHGFAFDLPDGRRQYLSLNIDYMALAQHYGIKTELLDLTGDKFVAAFFACTDYDADTDSYSVHQGNDDYGVFYTYFDREVPVFSISRPKRMRVVGLQPFSRPGEQVGYVLSMNEGDDFNNLCRECIMFRHNEDVARLIFNYTNRQKRLFPDDILDTKIPEIKRSKKFSKKAYEIAVSEFYSTASTQILEKYLLDMGIEIVGEPIVSFSDEELKNFRKNWKEKDEQRFISRVICRPVYFGEVDEIPAGSI